jgi:hypothetical protein
MTTTADQVYQLVKAMSEEQSRWVLRFAQFVQLQEGRFPSLSTVTRTEDIQAWRQLVGELSGAWPDMPMAKELRATL